MKITVDSMKNRLNAMLSGILIMIPALLIGQSTDEFMNNMIDRVDRYFNDRPRENIYVHTDRSVYFNGDNILFHAIITEAANLRASEGNTELYIALMDPEGKEVISSSYDISKGKVDGSFTVPGNLDQGNYTLLAFTKKDEMFTANKVYNKDIIITDPASQLMVSYSFDKDFYVPGEQVNMFLKVYGYRSSPVSKVTVDYKLTAGNELIKSGTGTTGKDGALVISTELPSNFREHAVLHFEAKKRRTMQNISVSIPYAKPVESKVLTTGKSGVDLQVEEVSLDRLKISTSYDPNRIDGDKKVVMAIFRKGLLYWSAPGAIKQASSITVPVNRIPSGILDIVIFDPDGFVLAEKMVYFEHENSPWIDLQLYGESFNKRQLVRAEVSYKGNFTSLPQGTSLVVSVAPKDMIGENEIMLANYMLLDVDLQQDTKELLSYTKDPAIQKEQIRKMLDRYDRNGYSWESILQDEETPASAIGENFPEEKNWFKGFPGWFNAEKMKEYSHGIVDNRQPNAQQQAYKRQLASGMSVLEVIKTIKPYTMYGNKIIFPGKLNSLYAQQGALIVVDGHMMGQDATVLNSITPTDVESIFVSTEPRDIQKYTALNSVGLVEVNMKGYGPASRISGDTSRDDLIHDSFGNYLPGYPDYSLEKDVRSITRDNRSLLLWEPDLRPDENQKSHIEFYTSDIAGTYVVTVQGMVGVYPVALQKEFVVH